MSRTLLKSSGATPVPKVCYSPEFRCALAGISRHGSGRAGLQPRRKKDFLIIPVCRAPRSPDASGLRGGQDEQRTAAANSAGLKPRPSGNIRPNNEGRR